MLVFGDGIVNRISTFHDLHATMMSDAITGRFVSRRHGSSRCAAITAIEEGQRKVSKGIQPKLVRLRGAVRWLSDTLAQHALVAIPEIHEDGTIVEHQERCANRDVAVR
jgi:hypothetical protein